jgi:hypothetical protein
MKKIFYSILAVVALVGCAKEMEAPVKGDGPVEGGAYEVSIKAFAADDNLTKTAYAANGSFSWLQKDTIRVRLKNAVSGARSMVNMYAKSSGASTDFAVTLSADNWRPDSIAVYSPFKTAFTNEICNGSSVCVSMPLAYCMDGANKSNASYHNRVSFSSENPFSILPLVGVQQLDGSFKFQTAVGVLHVQVTGLESAAAGIKLTSVDGSISNYLMVRDGAIAMGDALIDEGTNWSRNYIYYFFNQQEDHSASVYVPVPVGTLKAGSTVSVVNEDGDVLFTQEFKQDVAVSRNKVVELAPFKGSYDWVSVGTGKFKDAYMWAEAGFADEFVDVEIQKNASDAKAFRLVNPYGAAITKFGYSTTETPYGPDATLSFRVVEVGESINGVTVTKPDQVWFDVYNTGIVDGSLKVDPFIAHPGRWATTFDENSWLRNVVTKYQSDGSTPASVQLAPVYFWLTDPAAGRGSRDPNNISSNNIIEILFPGQESVDLTLDVKPGEASPDGDGKVTAPVNVSFGSGIAGLKLVIATSAEEAEAAIAAGTLVTDASAAGDYTVSFPSGEISGEYFVFAKTVVASGLSAGAVQLYQSEKVSGWVSMGTGYYYDYPVFYSEGANNFVAVEFFRDFTQDGVFRIANPYKAIAAAANYSIPAAYTADMADYLPISVNLSTNLVSFPSRFYTGYGDGSDGSVFIAHPNNWGGSGDFSFVARYQADGKTPANIVLSPYYLYVKAAGGTYYYFNSASDTYMWISIVFPGVNQTIDIEAEVAYDSIADDTPASPSANVSLTLGDDQSGAYIAIAATEAAAKAIIDAGNGYKADASGEYVVNMPADAPSGSYIVCAVTIPAEGFTSNCALTVTSEPFDYHRSDEDRHLTMDDIIGTYSVGSNYYYNSDNGTWAQTPQTLVIEESDSPERGEIMFSTVLPEILGSGVTQVDNAYAWYDTKTGTVLVEAGQTIYKKDGVDCVLGSSSGDDIELLLQEPGLLVAKSNFAYFKGGSRYAWTNGAPTFTRASSSGAPAKVSARHKDTSFSKRYSVNNAFVVPQWMERCDKRAYESR